MRKVYTLALSGVVLLTACSSGKGAQVVEGAVVIDSAELRLDIPQDWSIFTGDEVYEAIYPQYSDVYTDPDGMKKIMEDAGEEYIAYAVSADSGALILVTLQDMSGAEERSTLDELARTLHDSTIFDYLASDFRTGSNSVFEKRELAENGGWLSFFEVYAPQDGEREFVLAQEQFMFERGDMIYSVQLMYSDKDSGLRLENIISGAE